MQVLHARPWRWARAAGCAHRAVATTPIGAGVLVVGRPTWRAGGDGPTDWRRSRGAAPPCRRRRRRPSIGWMRARRGPIEVAGHLRGASDRRGCATMSVCDHNVMAICRRTSDSRVQVFRHDRRWADAVSDRRQEDEARRLAPGGSPASRCADSRKKMSARSAAQYQPTALVACRRSPPTHAHREW